jgi:hypothetical protein
MTQSTQSFEYYSKDNINTMLEALDYSRAADMRLIIDQKCKDCGIQEWVNNLKLQSELVKSAKSKRKNFLKELQTNLYSNILPELEVVNKMSLIDITAYEAMLVNKMYNNKLSCNLNVNLLFHLKIINNHLIYKFKIFE